MNKPARLVSIDLGPMADRAHALAEAGGFASLSELVQTALAAFEEEQAAEAETPPGYDAWLEKRLAEVEAEGPDAPTYSIEEVRAHIREWRDRPDEA